MRMTLFALLFTLAAIGISETSYLIRVRRAHENPVCLGGESCQIVLRSKYSSLFFIKNDVLGLVYYFVLATILGLIVSGTGDLSLLVLVSKILLIAGSIMSLFLTYLQWQVIKAWCTWCLLSASTIWLMTILFFLYSIFFPTLV